MIFFANIMSIYYFVVFCCKSKFTDEIWVSLLYCILASVIPKTPSTGNITFGDINNPSHRFFVLYIWPSPPTAVSSVKTHF